MQVTVVGAGVIGLSVAVRLAEAGHEVHVVADARSPNTTSDVAAALHWPFLAQPRERVEAWADVTQDVFAGLVKEGCGVSQTPVVEYFPGEPPVDAPIQRMAPTPHADVPPGYATALAATSYLIDMKRYLPYLEERAIGLGVDITMRHLERLPDGCVVNAAGLGARRLVPDESMVPTQGQVVRLQDPGLDTVRLDLRPDHLVYIMPFGDRVVVGGTAIPGAEDLTPHPAVEAAILERARVLEPRLEGCEVLERLVGLRPSRPEVRLEKEGDVVHCYGHGGSGVTMSWGCADEVVALLD